MNEISDKEKTRKKKDERNDSERILIRKKDAIFNDHKADISNFAISVGQFGAVNQVMSHSIWKAFFSFGFETGREENIFNHFRLFSFAEHWTWAEKKDDKNGDDRIAGRDDAGASKMLRALKFHPSRTDEVEWKESKAMESNELDSK